MTIHHHFKGTNIQLSADGQTARRTAGYGNAICSSASPLAAIDGVREYEILITKQAERGYSTALSCGISNCAPYKIEGDFRTYGNYGKDLIPRPAARRTSSNSTPINATPTANPSSVPAHSWILESTCMYYDGCEINDGYASKASNKQGHGLSSLGTGHKVRVVLDKIGTLRFFFDDVDMGIAATNIPVDGDMWAIFDVYSKL